MTGEFMEDAKIITLARGESESIPIQMTNENNVAVDITGTTVLFTVKESLDSMSIDDSDALIAISQATHIAPLEGKTTIPITSEHTKNLSPGAYYYEVKVIYPEGTPDPVDVYPYGVFKISSSFTQRES